MQDDKYVPICILLHVNIHFDMHNLLRMPSFFPVCVFGFFRQKNMLFISVWITMWGVQLNFVNQSAYFKLYMFVGCFSLPFEAR